MDDPLSGRRVRAILLIALIFGGLVGWLTAPLVWVSGQGYVWMQ